MASRGALRRIAATMADQRFDVAIIGAGIVGTSIAYHLAMLGCTNVAVLDKETTPGSGSTAKAAGGIRAQFSSEINIQLSKMSIERFERFAQEMGVEVEFFQVGYLCIATKPAEMKLFEENAKLQEKLGLSIERLDAEGIRARAPYVRTDDVVIRERSPASDRSVFVLLKGASSPTSRTLERSATWSSSEASPANVGSST